MENLSKVQCILSTVADYEYYARANVHAGNSPTIISCEQWLNQIDFELIFKSFLNELSFFENYVVII